MGHPSFEHAATLVLARLQHAMFDLLRSVSGPVRKASEVERAFGVDYKLGWQIHRIATVANPLVAGSSVPARVSIEKLLVAAARRGVPAGVREEVSASFEAFERLIETEAGDRAELDAMIAALVPETREKQEQATKQAAFRALSQVKGVAMESQISTFLLHPSPDGRMVDRVSFSGYVGLRRLRAGAHIEFSTFGALTGNVVVRTLEGEKPSDAHGILLPQFCSRPTPRFETTKLGEQSIYTLAGSSVGMRSAVDLYLAEHRPGAMRRYKMDGKIMTGVMTVADMPTKRQTIDLIVHQDVYPGAEPRLGAYDTVPRGIVTTLNAPAREIDRLPFQETVRPMAGGIGGARLNHVARYEEMLAHVCEKMGWDAGAFRGYRLDVEYPFYGGQYMIGFDLPDGPDCPSSTG